ncbi:MAG TPA: ABC transporter permease subunit [Anaerolineaceae bacterium]|nr:ABC transporter permease subunit [Anaerolineaceae bacterium]
MSRNPEAHQAIVQAKQALQREDRLAARQLAFLAARLDPTDETPWLILAALSAPQASINYLHKALEINPGSVSAKKGLVWAQNNLNLENASKAGTQTAQVLLQPAPQSEITRPLHVLPKSRGRARWFQFWLGEPAVGARRAGSRTLGRVAKYTLLRSITLFSTIVASVFLIIYIANLGGYLDSIQKGLIEENINGMLMAGWLKGTPPDERQQFIDQTRMQMQASFGLDQPYPVRVAGWLVRGITLDWGKSRFEYVLSSTYMDGAVTGVVTSDDIRTEIFSYLPRTLLLLGLSNLGLFLGSVLIALLLARRTGSWIDRVMISLAPISAAPSWMFGLILIIIFYRILGNYSFSLGVTAWRTEFNLDFIPILMRGLLLPFMAIFLSKFFHSIYAWRSYFYTFSNESYIELAKAKGLPPHVLERRYLLRPALPSIITSFALIVITIWQECIAVEYFFNVGGIGSFFVQALGNNDIGVIVALVSTFAYFLAITVFILDIAYVLVDPRLKIENETQSEKPLRSKAKFGLDFQFPGKEKPSRQSRQAFKSPAHATEIQIERSTFAEHVQTVRHKLAGIGRAMAEFSRDLARFPSAIVGVVIIAVLLIISVGTVIAIPYGKAIRLWRGDDKAWIRNPIDAPPAWINFFRQQKLPENIRLSSQDGTATKLVTPGSNGNSAITINFQFDYAYNSLPQDVLVLFTPRYTTKQPFVILTWTMPDGKAIRLKNTAVSKDGMIFFSNDKEIVSKLNTATPAQMLFAKPNDSPGEAFKGRYELRLDGFTFEQGSDLDAELIVQGKVYGLAGTDGQRRDLSLALLWGTVAALSFGILAAIVTTISSVTLAAAGAWFGGWIDGLIQRISEINMVLPILPTCILVFFLYSKSFWVILGVTVGLSIFGNSIKNYRAIFLQIKQLPYVEAASAYGASSWRIIFQYLVPRVRSVLIPQLVILVPSYIFFESTLSFLGVSDPFLPTLGKLLVSTLQGSLAGRPFFQLLEPVGMLTLIALSFALPGFALERLYNEKLGV